MFSDASDRVEAVQPRESARVSRGSIPGYEGRFQVVAFVIRASSACGAHFDDQMKEAGIMQPWETSGPVSAGRRKLKLSSE